ncbi:DNA-3-methyladenine glycosylase [Metallococcus carri]|uniref:DNA-3-methyladenine glycosylase n=1 Tax=Metallococcus carri TaxID=1656884 RepID=UPI002E29901B|nr:DNA-3-methyladenine glycosylase [Metallococcus carri]
MPEPVSVAIARRLLGATLHGRGVSVRLTEVEAYAGPRDPGSHAYRGRTARNAVMFGPAGHLYCYFTYGMHTCCNYVCGPEGEAAAVLLRAGQVVEGLDLARERRAGARDVDLARGPARLTVALGITLSDNGIDLNAAGAQVRLTPRARSLPSDRIRSGPRVGVSGPGGDGAAYPWRFWLDGEPSVSAYRVSRRPS